MRIFTILVIFMVSVYSIGCSKKFVNRFPIGENFPSVKGQSLEKKIYNIPEDFKGEKVLFLIGYVQNTQFDIDRWTIGLDQSGSKVKIFERPATQGFFPIFLKLD